MTNDENPKTHRAKGASLFFPQNAGASDNAAGVGARLLALSRSLSLLLQGLSDEHWG